MTDTRCFAVFEQCVRAVRSGELIESESPRDKEFHFQNWFEARLRQTGARFEVGGRNTFPDFSLVECPEGYEIKGLRWPGREQSYDSNSRTPSGAHDGHRIFYVFGRYPADLTPFTDPGGSRRRYPVVDLVICHGDFLNAEHEYVHRNRSVKGFGAYGDVLIRDRKMYVAPTPFALTEGTTGLMTLIVPETWKAPDAFQQVGQLVRREAARLVVAYEFDLRTNEIAVRREPNPHAGAEHRFAAWRWKSQPDQPVTLSRPADGRG